MTVYDVAPTVLSMFDESLAKYAMDSFHREGINIKTSRQVESLSHGLPSGSPDARDPSRPGLTLKVKDEPDMGTGMVVWSTGLMPNPFIQKTLKAKREFLPKEVIFKSNLEDAWNSQWTIRTDKKTGSIVTNDRLRVILEAPDREGHPMPAYIRDVFGIGDCAIIQGTQYPATAQVASQKAAWLAQRLNRNDLQTTRFQWKNLGVMAYIGNWKAILQGGGSMGNVSGRAAWILWRGAYLTKSMSWRNRILIPVYW